MIPVVPGPLACRFDGDPAVLALVLEAGCVGYPGDRFQFLCPQHAMRSTPLGESVAVWTDPFWLERCASG